MKISRLDMVETTPSGEIMVRIAKLNYEGDELIIGYHRASFGSVDPFEDTLKIVNDDLVQQGYTALTFEDIATIKAAAPA